MCEGGKAIDLANYGIQSFKNIPTIFWGDLSRENLRYLFPEQYAISYASIHREIMKAATVPRNDLLKPKQN